MGQSCRAVIAVLGLAACNSKSEPTAGSSTAPAVTPASGPITVAFGDCAGPSATFVSGSRPLAPSVPVVPPATGGDGIGSGGGGTIGIGRYQTLGGGHGRPSNAPTVTIGMPVSKGELDKAIIRRYLKRNAPKLQYCYEKAILTNPSLGSGAIEATFTITPEGQVDSAKATGLDPGVATCARTVIAGIEFPKPKDGRAVTVSYPFTFKNPAPAPPGSASPPPPPTTPPAPSTTVGATNPLREHAGSLAACFRKAARPYGVMVVELGYDAAGAVANATAHGDSTDVGACVVAIAKTTKRAAGTTTAERCSLAFGTMPLVEAPGVEVTATAVIADGKPVAQIDALVRDAAVTIPAIHDPIAASTAAWKVAPPVVALRGPYVIRATAPTPMKVINMILASATTGGAEPVLAARRDDTDWALLAARALPVPPVATAAGAAEDPAVTLSILVTKDTIWLGLSRVNEFTEIRREPGAWTDRLAKSLRDQKSSAFFADRSDLEIAGAPEIPFAEIAQVAAIARAEGFGDLVVVPPASLAAVPSL